MHKPAGFFKKIVCVILLASISMPAWATFRVRRDSFNFKVLETAHIRLLYHTASNQSARRVILFAEQQWNDLARATGTRYMPGRVTVVLYGSQSKFLQNTINENPLGRGVGGFTEPYLHRVVMPCYPSIYYTRHTIRHEMFHAVQFHLLYHDDPGNMLLFYKSVLFNLPQWMEEGGAEYFSAARDGYDRMWTRDRALSGGSFPSLDSLYRFSQLDPNQGYTAYQLSADAVKYLADRFGRQSIMRFIRLSRVNPDILASLTKQVFGGMTFKQLSENWLAHTMARTAAFSADTKPPFSHATNCTPAFGRIHAMRRLAVPSPDSRHLAWFSDEIDAGQSHIFTGGPRGSNPVDITNRLIPSRLDAVNRHGKPISWMPDGKHVVFAGTKKQRPFICIQAIDGSHLRTVAVDFDDIESVSVSPDGKSVAFSGMHDGTSGVYILDFKSRTVISVWHEENAAVYEPSFAPDGKTIAVVVEKAPDFDPDIWLVNRDGTNRRRLLKQPGLEHRPAWTADGKWVLFDSDALGGLDIMAASPASPGQAWRVTRCNTGVFGPACSSDGTIYYTGLWHGNLNVYAKQMRPRAWRKVRAAESRPAFKPESVSITARKYKSTPRCEFLVAPDIFTWGFPLGISAQISDDTGRYRLYTGIGMSSWGLNAVAYGAGPDLYFTFNHGLHTGLSETETGLQTAIDESTLLNLGINSRASLNSFITNGIYDCRTFNGWLPTGGYRAHAKFYMTLGGGPANDFILEMEKAFNRGNDQVIETGMDWFTLLATFNSSGMDTGIKPFSGMENLFDASDSLLSIWGRYRLVTALGDDLTLLGDVWNAASVRYIGVSAAFQLADVYRRTGTIPPDIVSSFQMEFTTNVFILRMPAPLEFGVRFRLLKHLSGNVADIPDSQVDFVFRGLSY